MSERYSREMNTRWKEEATPTQAVDHGLSENEYERLIKHLGRPISLLELGICAALFSEHCSYKSTKIHLSNLPSNGERVIEGPGENAGVVDIGDGQAATFKVESHNHPSFIEPFQGAATGVGGILRDVFTMGARPVALLNSLRFGEPKLPKTKHLIQDAVKGIGTYGNCMGIPTVGGELFFHSSYNGNCLVNAFALGIVNHDEIFRGRASGIGNPVYYVGSKTGRDGIHGATMASEEFGSDSQSKRPTVQVGDPFQEKLLLEACLEAMGTGAVVGIQDMGAAGMTSSSYEMAERACSGLRIDLELVPQREANMNPYEIMLSESQERMLLVVESGREQEIEKIFTHWELDVVKIGEVTSGDEVVLSWHGEEVSRMKPSLLSAALPRYQWPEEAPMDSEAKLSFNPLDLDPPQDCNQTLLRLIASPNMCSRAPLFEQYDSTVGANTVICPGGDAAVVRVPGRRNPNKGIAVSLDCNSLYCATDPRLGASLAIVEGVRNLTAVGAEPIGISDCLNFGNPQKPSGMWQIAEGIRGLADAANGLSVPIVSGNVSLYNETKGNSVLPTPTVASVGLIKDVNNCREIYFKSAGDKVLVIGDHSCFRQLAETLGADGAKAHPQINVGLGSSAYLSEILEIERGAPPTVNYQQEQKYSKVVMVLIEQGLLQSCHDISSGGLAVCVAEACMAQEGAIGVRLEPLIDPKRSDVLLFSEAGPRYLISFSPSKEKKIRKILEAAEAEIGLAGEVGGDEIIIERYLSVKVSELFEAWNSGLVSLFE